MLVTCSVVGATSLTGNELIRLLANHPRVRIASLTSRGDDRVYARELVPSLGKTNDLTIEKFNFKKVAQKSQVVFLTLPHTLTMKIAGDFYDHGNIVIDLSADFRLSRASVYEQWYGERHRRKDLLKEAVYGLPEVNREAIGNANLIANPGCYPTGAILGLKPLLEANLIERDSIVIDSKSGVSGAGKKLSFATQFAEVDENFGAYKVNQHQHTPEIEGVLSLVAGEKVKVTFVPHLLPVYRGILSTIYAKRRPKLKKKAVLEAFEQFSKNEPFIRFLGYNRFPTLRQVQRTNFCDMGVTVDESSGQVIVISAIDNLVKGASGQAIQNMNIRMGFPEESGLIG
jgi:N-acetyl-gamma-glutamyl-phosphate reductase